MRAKAICRILSDESQVYSVLVDDGSEDRVEIDCTGRDAAYDLIKAIERNASDVEMDEPEVIDEFKHSRQYQGIDLSTGEDKTVFQP